VPLVTGTRLGTYEVIAPLGAGGMGEVYRAHDTRLGRDVAIKLLPQDVASSPERLARLEREARTVAGLNHPNIVTLHTIEEAENIRFLVMELVEGRDLSTMVASGGLPLGQVLDVAIPLADALVAAHERRVVHRDLKPSNVMVTRDGRVKVLDFGLAKLINLDAELDETRAIAITDIRQVMGTRPYMAPEQIRGEEIDARADVFAFGVVVYELAAGQRPFRGGSSADVTSAILRDAPPPLSSVRADLPADLERILERCLEKNRRERFQTALDVANELRALKRNIERGPSPRTAAPAEKVASIAVLPFMNRSASTEDEYFSDGLADELLSLLAKIRGFRVAARTSSFHFKGKDTSVAEIGRALNVATLLEGSVRKAGTRVRISVQLVKVADGFQLWSETYDRTLEDIIAVQDDIAQAVVKELRSTLLGEEADSKASGEVRAEVSRAARGRATDPEAHRLYLLARYLVERVTRANTEKAIEYLKQALELEPEFALAWAELGMAYAREGSLTWKPRAEAYARAREAVERALALEPDLAEGHAMLAWIHIAYDWDWSGAEVSLRRALELAPGSAEALRRAGVLARTLGRVEEAIGFYGRALERDPLSASTYHNLGVVLHAADRLDEAEEAFRKVLELVPQSPMAHSFLALILLARGRGSEALAEAAAEPHDVRRVWTLAIVHHVLMDRDRSDELLRQLIEKYAADAGCAIADVYAVRGEADAAFLWLERAYDQRDGRLTATKLSPTLRSLHGDPRWGAFLNKMGLEE
jgi:serine/threonine-protein kinase